MKTFLTNVDSEVQIRLTVTAVCLSIKFPAPRFVRKLDDKNIQAFKPSITKCKINTATQQTVGTPH